MKRIAVVLFLVVMLAGCNWWIHIPEPEYIVVEYRVEGTVTRANLAWKNAAQKNVALPWSFSDEEALAGDELYLSAQGLDAVGTLTVILLADGVSVAAETIADPFGFVAVYGVVP